MCKYFPIYVAFPSCGVYDTVNDAVETSHAVVNLYTFTSSPAFPRINIVFPEESNQMSLDLLPDLNTLKESTNDALETSHAVVNVYSYTLSFRESRDKHFISGLAECESCRFCFLSLLH